MSLKKIAEAILDDQRDANRCYNWRTSEFRLYYDISTKKLWGRYEYIWEPTQTNDDIVILDVHGYDPASVKRSIRKVMKLADQGWRVIDCHNRPCNRVDGWVEFMKKF